MPMLASVVSSGIGSVAELSIQKGESQVGVSDGSSTGAGLQRELLSRSL
jgi:hypothetical protein